MLQGDISPARRLANTRTATSTVTIIVLYLSATALSMHPAWRLTLHGCAAALLVLTVVEQVMVPGREPKTRPPSRPRREPPPSPPGQTIPPGMIPPPATMPPPGGAPRPPDEEGQR